MIGLKRISNSQFLYRVCFPRAVLPNYHLSFHCSLSPTSCFTSCFVIEKPASCCAGGEEMQRRKRSGYRLVGNIGQALTVFSAAVRIRDNMNLVH